MSCILLELPDIIVQLFALHLEALKLCLGILFLCGVGKGILEVILKFLPENFVVCAYWSSASCTGNADFLIQDVDVIFDPILYFLALDEGECNDDSIICILEARVVSV